VPNEIRRVNGIYTVNPDFVVFLARNERPAGADQVAGAAAPIWLAALPPYTVNPDSLFSWQETSDQRERAKSPER